MRKRKKTKERKRSYYDVPYSDGSYKTKSTDANEQLEFCFNNKSKIGHRKKDVRSFIKTKNKLKQVKGTLKINMKKDQIKKATTVITAEPIVEFTAKAWRKIRYVVDKSKTEVGFMGSVDKINDPSNPLHFRVTDIWVPQQEVNGGTCEIKPAGRDALCRELMKAAPNMDEGMKITNSIRFWGHSHVRMGTFASGQDDSQILEFETCPYYIRGIFNQLGSVNLCLYHFAENTVYSEMTPVILEEMPEAERADLDKQMEQNVKEKTYTSYQSGSYSHYNSRNYDENGLDSAIGYQASSGDVAGQIIQWYPNKDSKDAALIRKRFKNDASWAAWSAEVEKNSPKEQNVKKYGYGAYDDDYGYYEDYYTSRDKETSKEDNSVVKTSKIDPLTGEIIDVEPEEAKETTVSDADINVSDEIPTTVGNVDTGNKGAVFNPKTMRFELEK